MNHRILQRYRKDSHTRSLCDEVNFNRSQLIQPLFIDEAVNGREKIRGLKGTERQDLESSLKQIEQDLEAGVNQFLLFYVPAEKTSAIPSTDFPAKSISRIKKEFGNATSIWVDTCLCSFTESGHCCFFRENSIDTEKTLSALSSMALSYIQAGANGVSPSDMMDGRVREIRTTLDSAGHSLTPIMSYSTKFSSSFYGPFRNAADSAPQFGDRRTYQIDVGNRTDAIRSSLRCAEEGADFLMVKPGMSSIDLISEIRSRTELPVGAYQVSGEYAGFHFLAEEGLARFEDILLESWKVFKRAGAQFIITYGARYGKELGIGN